MGQLFSSDAFCPLKEGISFFGTRSKSFHIQQRKSLKVSKIKENAEWDWLVPVAFSEIEVIILFRKNET